MKIQSVLGCLILVVACTSEPEMMTQEPQPAPTVDTSPVITASAEPVSAETPVPQTSQSPTSLKLSLELTSFALSAFYPLEIKLIQDNKQLEAHKFILAKQAAKTLELETEVPLTKPFQVQVQGSQIDRGCLTQMRFVLNSELIPLERLAAGPLLELRATEFESSIANPNCQHVYSQGGQVVDTQNSPLDAVRLQVELRNGDGSLSYFNALSSASNGRFEITDLPVGVFTRLTASKSGYATLSRTFSAQLDSQGQVDQLESLNIILAKN